MIKVSAPKKNINVTINLPGSKSISNRVLLIKKIFSPKTKLLNISDAEDTFLLKRAISIISKTKKATININHAGTDMRFLTALLAVTEGEWILTGSSRMKQRPIADLVNALKQIGASIDYLQEKGYPPLKINGKKLQGGEMEVNSGLSSQFTSALLLIAPLLQKDLVLKLKGNVASASYVNMTISALKEFGIHIKKQKNQIEVKVINKKTPIKKFVVESDWSSASYWYSICALNKSSKIQLNNLYKKSWQADSVLPTLYKQLGVKTSFNKKGVKLEYAEVYKKSFNYDFINCPDIAMTVAVTCFALRIKAKLTGLATLKHKESDRLNVMFAELKKLGAKVKMERDALIIDAGAKRQRESFTLPTYNDHRVAMSFAPLAAMLQHLVVQNPEVVTKSYPRFWRDLKKAGFKVNLQA